MTDLTKLILDSADGTFMNNKVWTGSCTISGNHTAGANTKTFTVALGQTPDLVDISFKGPSDPLGIDLRPSGGWFKDGAVYEQTADGGGGYPTWQLTSSINGTTLTITATYVQQYSGTYASTDTTFYYRLIDYSVFQ